MKRTHNQRGGIDIGGNSINLSNGERKPKRREKKRKERKKKIAMSGR